MNSKSLKFNTVLNAFRMVLTVLVPLITFPYTSRVFLTEGSGQINFVTSVVSVFTLFASLGIYGYGIREGAKVRDDKQKFTKLVVELFVINIIATIFTYIVFVILVAFYEGFANYKRLLLLNGLTIGFTALGLDWVYGTYEEYTYITLRQIFVQTFTVVAMFIFVHDESDIYIWMLMLTVSSITPNIYNFIHAKQYVCKLDNVQYELKKHIKPILILFATILAAKVYSSIDTFLLGIMSTDHNTGLYSAAVKVNTILITLFSAMSPVFMPRIGETLKNNQKDEYYKLLSKIFRMILSLTIPAVVGLEMVGNHLIIALAGTAFSDAIISMRILAPIVLITSCSNILYYDVFVPNGKEKAVLICTVVGAILNLIISWLLIPTFAQDGASIGSLISEAVALVLAMFYSYKMDKSIKSIFPPIRNYVLGAVAVVCCCLISGWLISSSLLYLFVAVLSSGICYFAVLYLTKDYMADELIVIFVKYFGKFLKRKD